MEVTATRFEHYESLRPAIFSVYVGAVERVRPAQMDEIAHLEERHGRTRKISFPA